MQNAPHNVVIIGSGPAGYTAALYAARADLNPVMYRGFQPGGQLMITTDVENYPGFPHGVMGPEMMQLFQEQAERFGTTIIDETITKVDFSQRPFKLWAGDQMVEAKSVIIATGASAKWLGLPTETEFGGYGVSACATCDGFFFRNKPVIVVGGGDTAMEEANYLTKHVSKVILVHRRDQFRASKIMQDRVLANPKVEVLYNTAVDEILGQREPVRKVTGARLKNVETGATSEVEVNGIFIAIGHKPNSDLFVNILEMDAVGYLKTQPGSTRTNIPGVFACGDVADAVYRQAVTAAGTGCMAAIDAERFLESEGH
ncbi:MAG: thioredoxin-disulfide reductase [Armatimonadetes bacterium]|nr:thioredoxin-disulfide reductase [Armatimonadota bacterium]